MSNLQIKFAKDMQNDEKKEVCWIIFLKFLKKFFFISKLLYPIEFININIIKYKLYNVIIRKTSLNKLKLKTIKYINTSVGIK